jgi:hypothetical protein
MVLSQVLLWCFRDLTPDRLAVAELSLYSDVFGLTMRQLEYLAACIGQSSTFAKLSPSFRELVFSFCRAGTAQFKPK